MSARSASTWTLRARWSPRPRSRARASSGLARSEIAPDGSMARSIRSASAADGEAAPRAPTAAAPPRRAPRGGHASARRPGRARRTPEREGLEDSPLLGPLEVALHVADAAERQRKADLRQPARLSHTRERLSRVLGGWLERKGERAAAAGGQPATRGEGGEDLGPAELPLRAVGHRSVLHLPVPRRSRHATSEDSRRLPGGRERICGVPRLLPAASSRSSAPCSPPAHPRRLFHRSRRRRRPCRRRRRSPDRTPPRRRPRAARRGRRALARVRLEEALAAAPARDDVRLELAEILIADGQDLQRAQSVLAGVRRRGVNARDLACGAVAEPEATTRRRRPRYGRALLVADDADVRLRRAVASSGLGRADEAARAERRARRGRRISRSGRGSPSCYEAAGDGRRPRPSPLAPEAQPDAAG